MTVTNPGGGNGRVVAPDPNVDLDCQFTAGTSSPTICEDEFDDAGGGGVFTLEAAPASGSTFVGWTGCSSSAGTVCTLTFQATGFDTSFRVQARFDLTATVGANLLANPGFESAVAVGTLPSVTGQWRGDSAYAMGPDQGITPASGARMLRFVRSGLQPGAGFVSSQQWQLVDVSAMAADIDAGKIRFNASAWFHRVIGDTETDTRFELRVLSFTGTPANFPTDYPNPAGAKGDTVFTTGAAWQEGSVIGTLAAGTRYLAVEIYAFEDIHDDAIDPEFDGHYADQVSLILTKLP